MAELPDHLVDYRKFLEAAGQKSQEDFDKTVLSLSGGALGISFVFLKDVGGGKPVEWPSILLASWVCWGASTLCVLLSFHLSYLAVRETIRQVDEDDFNGKQAGGKYSTVTAWLNAFGASLFFLGVVFITCFASANLSKIGVTDAKPQSTAAASASTTPPAAASTASAARAGSGDRGK